MFQLLIRLSLFAMSFAGIRVLRLRTIPAVLSGLTSLIGRIKVGRSPSDIAARGRKTFLTKRLLMKLAPKSGFLRSRRNRLF